MKILIIGASGQLGKAFIKNIPNDKKNNLKFIAPYRKDFDLAKDFDQIDTYISFHKPDWVLNFAAYTEVDKAEKESELSYKINALVPRAIAFSLSKQKGRMIQISTDYVFSGEKNYAYLPNDPKKPLNQYGRGKSDGEDYVCEILEKRSHIIRTSWLYGTEGNNFLLTMLRLHNKKGAKKEILKVISDQISCPTSTTSLAKFCWEIILNKNIFFPQKLHWTEKGFCSWFNFSEEIGKLALQKNLIKRNAIVKPISTIDYYSLAKRPNFSLLDSRKSWDLIKQNPIHWKISLSRELDQIQKKFL